MVVGGGVSIECEYRGEYGRMEGWMDGRMYGWMYKSSDT